MTGYEYHHVRLSTSLLMFSSIYGERVKDNTASDRNSKHTTLRLISTIHTVVREIFKGENFPKLRGLVTTRESSLTAFCWVRRSDPLTFLFPNQSQK